MNLLRETNTAGPPSDYLFARIRCRRAALDISGRSQVAGPAEPHQKLKAEHAWVYTQLNQRLRLCLRPYFEYGELRNMVIALRYLAAGNRTTLRPHLQFSLLHLQLRKILLNTAQVMPVIRLLERLLADTYPFFNGLTEHYLRQGPGGLEQALLGGCLQQAAAHNRCPALQAVLTYLLDMRNLLGLYKHLHWQLPSPPPLLTGGELGVARCEKVWSARDMDKLLDLVRKRAANSGNPEAVGVEDFLFQGLTQRLRAVGQDPLQAGLILDFLWRCQLATRNRGLLLADAHLPQQRATPEVMG